jgi:hypothetical protein
MVRRAAWLVRERGADPDSLLVTTFTEAAADELFDRLHRFLGPSTNDVHISTLHAFCRRVLEDHPRAQVWGRGFRAERRTPPRRSRSTGWWPGSGAATGSCSAKEGLLDFSTLQSVAWGVLWEPPDEAPPGSREQGREEGERDAPGAGGADGPEGAAGPTLAEGGTALARRAS